MSLLATACDVTAVVFACTDEAECPTGVCTNGVCTNGVCTSPLEPVAAGEGEGEGELYATCFELLIAEPATPSGVHTLLIDGVEVDLECDMTTEGGGGRR